MPNNQSHSEEWEKSDGSFDDEKALQIVQALGYLRQEAQRTSNQQIALLISSAFNMCVVAYSIANTSAAQNFTKNLNITKHDS